MSNPTDPRFDQWIRDTQVVPVEPGTNPQHGQVETDHHSSDAVLGTNSQGAQVDPDTQWEVGALGQTPRPARSESTPTPRAPVVDPLLFIHATAHNDLEQLRVASQNRLRILTTDEPDDDGVMRGFGLDETQPDVARLRGITDALIALEHDAELGLKRSLRRGSIHPWVKAQIGLGDKTIARLLASTGDPYWHLAEDRPRTLSELRSYCGYGEGEKGSGQIAKRRKGVTSNWSADAKMRTYLCAVSCIWKVKSPYRAVYDTRRAHTAVTHPDWTKGHSHNDALRIVSKTILRDLWRESRRLHGADETQLAA